MRLPRLSLRLRTLLLLVALVALALVGHRIYLDGPDAHWLLLKLRYGNVEARRSATLQARESAYGLEPAFSLPDDPSAWPEWRLRRQRRAVLLLPALLSLMEDPDAECRANAVRAVRAWAGRHPSKTEKVRALRRILAVTRDRDGSVRAAALESLTAYAFVTHDTEAVINAFRSALSDPSIDVRQKAADGLGGLGVIIPTTQSDAASILIPLLASREDARVRVKAARGLSYFGVDLRRHPPAVGPDVVPALVTALRDPEVDVRRTVAMLLGLTTLDARGKRITSWDRRKDSIIPALKASIADEDMAVRVGSALALFAMGLRDAAIIELIEQGVHDPDRTRRSRSVSALEEWEDEQGADDPVDPAMSAESDVSQQPTHD